MPLSSPSSIYLEADMLCDWKSVIRKIENMKNVTVRSNVFMDSKLMMLKLRRARLGAQLAYSRHQSLLAEIELRLAEADLKSELTRRRQFVTRSRVIRQTMKSLPSVASKEIQTTEIDKDNDQPAQNLDNTDRVERRKDDVSSQRKRHKEKDTLGKEKTKSRVGTDESHSKATTSNKEIKNSKPNKKPKTVVESQCTDKGENTNRHNKYSREERKERRDGKKSSKDKSCKTQDTKKSASSINKQELHNNDKHIGKDSETNEKHAKKRHEAQDKKVSKSVSKHPTTKDIRQSFDQQYNRQSVSTVSNNQEKGNKSEEYSEPKLQWDIEKTPLTVEEIRTVEEEKDEAVQPKKTNKFNICSNSSNLEKTDAANILDFTVALEVKDRNVHQILRLDNDFEEFRVMKRERANSISSVETLKL